MRDKRTPKDVCGEAKGNDASLSIFGILTVSDTVFIP